LPDVRRRGGAGRARPRRASNAPPPNRPSWPPAPTHAARARAPPPHAAPPRPARRSAAPRPARRQAPPPPPALSAPRFLYIQVPDAGKHSRSASREAEGTGPMKPRQPARPSKVPTPAGPSGPGGCVEREEGECSARHRPTLSHLRDRARSRARRRLFALLRAARPGLRLGRARRDGHARVDRVGPALAVALLGAAAGRGAGRAAARPGLDAPRFGAAARG